MARNALRWVWLWLLRPFVALVLAYALAGIGGALIATNNGWTQAKAGVRIFVIDNGVHTDLVLPANAEGVDWRVSARPQDIGDPGRAALPYVSFGWGDRDFYLNTPTWADISLPRLASAMVGAGRTVLHVAHIAEPGAGPHMRSVMLTPEEYHRLAAYVAATFANGPSVRGYGADDAFYPARGGYSALDTCNQWTGGALRAAGVRIGAWTPLTFTVTEWL